VWLSPTDALSHLMIQSTGIAAATTQRCGIAARDITPGLASATDRLATIEHDRRVADSLARVHFNATGDVMNLLVVFILALLVGQSISVSVGLLAERLFSPYTGLVTFIAMYFVMFWVTWKVSVWLTEPRSHVGKSLHTDAR